MKISCVNPDHDDKEPSMEVYEDRAYCFSCGYSVPSEEVVDALDLKKLRREKTDIQAVLNYVEELPLRPVRGLVLPFDGRGYFIVWPDNSFYKKRMLEGNNRYIGPSGHKPPLYVFERSKTDLVIVEGELNALSLAKSKVTTATIASPGSAVELNKHLNKYLTYQNIVIIVDKDAAGVSNGLELKNTLMSNKKKVSLVACEKDINQILQDSGHEGVREWYKKEVGVSSWVPGD